MTKSDVMPWQRRGKPHHHASMFGWRYRGYLPHVDYPHLWQSVTFRLADSVPRSVVERWKREIEGIPSGEREKALRTLIDTHEDNGYGSCVLRGGQCARAVMDQLAAGDQTAYRIAAWVIMPNHVHVLVGPMKDQRVDLSRIIGKWKGASSRLINQILDRSGPLWQPESFDRWIRDDQHFSSVVAYIANNPVKAGLCRSASDWRWSHAWQGE